MHKLLSALAVGLLVLGSGSAYAAQPPLLVDVEVIGEGTVTSTLAGIDCPSTCQNEYPKNTKVELEAVPDEGFDFVGWIGGCVGTVPQCSVSNKNTDPITAVFTALAVPAPVAATGQITFNVLGDDGDIRAGVGLPIPRFTDTGEGTVIDELTGLEWLKDVGCIGGLPWFDAIAAVDDPNLGIDFSCSEYVAGAHDDWRLPNIKEIQSLANYEFFNPTISNTNGDGPAMEGDPFISLPEASDPVPVVWSSTASADGFNDFFAVDVVQYEINRAGPDSQSGSQHRVWPVRGGSVPLN